MTDEPEWKPKPAEVLIAFALLVPVQLLSALYASTVWRWYVEPLGAPHVGVVTAFALANLWQIVRFGPSRKMPAEGPIVRMLTIAGVETLTFLLVAIVRAVSR